MGGILVSLESGERSWVYVSIKQVTSFLLLFQSYIIIWLLYGSIGHSWSIIICNALDKLGYVMHDNQTYICISNLDKSRVLFD